jgi:hypothetical protein
MNHFDLNELKLYENMAMKHIGINYSGSSVHANRHYCKCVDLKKLFS